ncbi:hypothetical protein [Cupriavidus sp. D384]|uniref:hypothetical protein n=1 Tax=Cupriavidus sp. D384 TaxID=1538095 RepID=UPI000B301296|nr:hypothetical protein [Cupriavidus sp. D384]
MTIDHHIGLETSTSLLHAYDFVAREHKKMRRSASMERELSGAPSAPVPPRQTFDFYATTFNLLSLNAAIVEGTMRSILSDRVLGDRRAAIERAVAEGRTGPTSSERLVELFHMNAELNGGWENLKGQYQDYLDMKMSVIVPSTTFEAIESLFTLRNVLAHGTALVAPKDKMEDDQKDVYPFKWQTKLQRATVLLERNFKQGTIFANLAVDGVPEYFWTETQAFFAAIKPEFPELPDRVIKTVDKIADFSFGYRNFG